jgi:phospholipase/lecithinase/hemolysin
MEGVMAYSGVYVFGDSLVDAGNVLKLADWYGGLTFSEVDGAPYPEDGYYLGRFSNGFTFADLISNKSIGTVTKPIFPYGYEDPIFGLPIDPLASDPSGNNLNFAYGGAQIRQGDLPDLDQQTDAFKDAVDNHAPSGALYIVTMGGNDVRALAPAGADPVNQEDAEEALRECALQLIHELTQLIASGARHFLITGVPDVGLIPKYDDEPGQPGYGALEGEEIARSAAATRYSEYLDNLIQTQVVPALIDALVARGVPRADAEKMINYVQIMDHHDALGNVSSEGALSQVLPMLEALHGLRAGELSANWFAHQDTIFFDRIHPNAQVHALIGAYMQADLTGAPWIENLPLLGADVDFASVATIGAAGEIDAVSIAMLAGSTYTFQLLGVSSLTHYVLGQLGIASLPAGPILADPSLKLLSPGSVVVKADDDSGAGFDSSLVYDVTSAGTYTLQMLGVGGLTGSYVLTATVAGTAMGNNSYTVNSASTLVIEAVGGGTDTVNASVSYALGAGSEIELLQTTNARGKSAINLTGNDFAQKIVGNAGANVLEGKGGADEYWGGSGNDRFVLSKSAITNPDGTQVDRIMDYAKGDVVDITQILSVAAGVNVTAAGYLRVTTGGLIQVDLDGGGNDWVTLSTINGSGSVTVRYLSGGSMRDVTVSRTADSAAVLAASVAAAGLVSPSAATETGFASDDLVTGIGMVAGHSLAAQVHSVAPLVNEFAVSGTIDAPAQSIPPILPAPHQASSQIVSGEAFSAPSAAPLALLPGTEAEPPHADYTLAAQAVAMPSAEMLLAFAGGEAADAKTTGEVGRVVVDALADGGEAEIHQLLATLPDAGANVLAVHFAGSAEAIFVTFPHALAMDAFAPHPDAAATA